MSTTHRQDELYAIAAQEDRCAPRVDLSIPGMLRPSGSKGFQTVVHNLSVGGFSATSINRLSKGTLCWLTLPGLSAMQCEVVWWENSTVGCAFDQLLSPVVHDNILARWRGMSGMYR